MRRIHLTGAHDDPKQIMRQLFESKHQTLLGAIKKGLWTSSELTAMGLTPSVARSYLTETNPEACRILETLGELSVHQRDYTVLEVDQLGIYLTLLDTLGCLDLVSASPIINQLRTHQVVTGNSLAGRKPLPDRTLVHGLFHCMHTNPLRDTYDALRVLSKLDGLDQIDREACIQGILRFHHGKGLFGSVKKNDGLFFMGETHDTLYAYESLRLLTALDQIKDLHKWVFRPRHTSKASAGKPTRQITWEEIEAWVLTQRLEQCETFKAYISA